jgi:hypothetical protein
MPLYYGCDEGAFFIADAEGFVGKCSTGLKSILSHQHKGK